MQTATKQDRILDGFRRVAVALPGATVEQDLDEVRVYFPPITIGERTFHNMSARIRVTDYRGVIVGLHDPSDRHPHSVGGPLCWPGSAHTQAESLVEGGDYLGALMVMFTHAAQVNPRGAYHLTPGTIACHECGEVMWDGMGECQYCRWILHKGHLRRCPGCAANLCPECFGPRYCPVCDEQLGEE